jgi:histidinol-phosphate/aromatic aminotransferase/cobyric acid decarboxylase-like protein
VRDITANPGLGGCLRITVGDERENGALIAAFRKIVGVG